MKKEKQPAEFRAYSLKEISTMYGVTGKSFIRWTKPFKEELGKREGAYYSLRQAKMFFEKFGHPTV